MTLRQFSPAGPCLTYKFGPVVKTTAKFFVFTDRYGETKRVAKTKVHTEPCPSCQDHHATQYPHGYMD